jgi:hypothetical protein
MTTLSQAAARGGEIPWLHTGAQVGVVVVRKRGETFYVGIRGKLVINSGLHKLVTNYLDIK